MDSYKSIIAALQLFSETMGMIMDEVTMQISFALLGASWLLFLYGITQAIIVFENKKSNIFIFCVIGLISGIIDVMMVTSMFFWGGDFKLLSVVVTPFWYAMIQCSTWAYCARIKTIGGILCKEKKYINYLPWFVLLLQIPSNALYLITLCTNYCAGITLVARAVFSILIAIVELFLYAVLLKNMNEILEYRVKIKKLLQLETTASVVFLILLDIVLIFSMLSHTNLDYILRPFTYILRIVVLIRFFTELLQELETNSFSRLTNMSDVIVQAQQDSHIEESSIK